MTKHSARNEASWLTLSGDGSRELLALLGGSVLYCNLRNSAGGTIAAGPVCESCAEGAAVQHRRLASSAVLCTLAELESIKH